MIRSVYHLSRILLTCLVQDHFRLLTCSITYVTFVISLTQMIFLSLYVMFNILLTIFVYAAAILFFIWPISAHVSAPYVIARVVDLCLQACSNVTMEDVIALHGKCYPSGRDFSLNPRVLIFVVLYLCERSSSQCCLHIILVRRFPSWPLSSTCSSSNPDIEFHHLIPTAVVVVHVVH